MRQRYLLGAYNRKRYTQDYQFLSLDEGDYDEVFTQSTNVNRTMQSGYSELMGLYQPSQDNVEKLTSAQAASIVSGSGLPPFQVRDSVVSAASTSLGDSPLPEGFI
jgi:hypothetical protein